MIIGVRFREAGRVYYFDPGQTQVNKGDRVIVETARGLECGEVAQENTDVPDEQIKQPLKRMVRTATKEDLRSLEGKEQREAEAFKVCEEKILKHELDMKLVNVEYTFDSSKIIFHFTADQRVDFRALVRDLAGHFRTRIELRQIGVRDEAKLLGGLGVCGRPFCCSLFMGDFHPVSIKMAKEQGLSLNPTKISGTCGRLMCCLKYEEAAYEDALKELPKPGSFIDSPEGRGLVTEVNAISKAVKVKLDRRPEAAPQVFLYDALEGLTRKPAFREGEAAAEVLPELTARAPAKLPDTPQPQHPRPQRRPDRPAQAERPAPAEKPVQAEPAEQREDTALRREDIALRREEASERRGDHKKGKNWRERHTPRKQEPAFRQPPPQQPRRAPGPQKPQAQPRPQQAAQAPQEQQQRSDVRSVPRYGEVKPSPQAPVPSPQAPVRRANAPQQQQGQNQGGGNYHRQAWQKNRGQQQQKKDGK